MRQIIMWIINQADVQDDPALRRSAVPAKLRLLPSDSDTQPASVCVGTGMCGSTGVHECVRVLCDCGYSAREGR